AEVVHEAEDRGVHLELRGETRAAAKGDAGRLKTAFRAVFRAILRETAGPATVVVDRRRVKEGAGSSAVIVVASSDRVDDAYAAPRRPFDEHRGGMGLALPLARRVLEKHGGAIWSPAFAGQTTESRGSAILTIPIPE